MLSDSLLPSTELVPGPVPWASHAAEIDLLRACARTDVRGYEEQIRRAAAAGLDWDVVAETATVQGVDGMAYHHLARLTPDAVPPGALRRLRGQSEGLLAFNLHRLRALLQLVTAFREAGVPVLTFKGPLLAHRYYGNLAFRRFGDIDLLVPRAALDQATAVLAEQGFVPAGATDVASVAAAQDAQIGREYGRPADDVWVELHWALLNKTFAFPLPLADVWDRSVTHAVGSVAVPGLAPEDLLLYLCAHGTKHHWAALKWMADVVAVVEATSPDWNALLRRARAFDLDRMLLLGLGLAHRWLGLALPAAVHTALGADRAVPALIRHVETRWLFQEAGGDRTPRADQLWFFLRSRRRWAHRRPMLAHYVGLALTPTDRDEAFLPLPPRLSALHYLARPVRLGVDWVRGRVPDASSSPRPD